MASQGLIGGGHALLLKIEVGSREEVGLVTIRSMLRIVKEAPRLRLRRILERSFSFVNSIETLGG